MAAALTCVETGVFTRRAMTLGLEAGLRQLGRLMMNERLFAELIRSAGQALEHAKGKRELRTTVLPAPPKPMSAREIRRLRRTLNASQAVFAHYCNVSTKLVQAWEADRRRAEGPALLLLRLAQANPAILLVRSSRAARVA